MITVKMCGLRTNGFRCRVCYTSTRMLLSFVYQDVVNRASNKTRRSSQMHHCRLRIAVCVKCKLYDCDPTLRGKAAPKLCWAQRHSTISSFFFFIKAIFKTHFATEKNHKILPQRVLARFPTLCFHHVCCHLLKCFCTLLLSTLPLF